MIRPSMVTRLFRRHAREILRERKTVFGLLLVPAVAVLITSLSRDEIASQVSHQGEVRYRVAAEGIDDAPSLRRFLTEGASSFDVTRVPDARRAARERRFDVAIDVAPGFERAIARGRTGNVDVITGRASIRARIASTGVTEALNEFGRATLVRRLRREGLKPSFAEPVRIVSEDVRTSRERSGSFLGEIVPLMLMAQMVGMMSGIATNVTAGEKERRTVEALLVTPMTRREIVAAKWLVTAVTGIAAGVITLVATLASVQVGVGTAGADASIPAGAVVNALIAVVATAAVVSAAQVLVGLWARSVQQAGVFIAPLFVVAFIALAFFQSSTGEGVGASTYALPVIGPIVLVRFSLMGTAAASAPLVVVLSSVVWVVLALLSATRIFASERSLART